MDRAIADRGVSLGCDSEIPNPRSGILRSLIERVSVKTDQTGREIELVGEITKMVRLASEFGLLWKGALPEFGKGGCGGRI